MTSGPPEGAGLPFTIASMRRRLAVPLLTLALVLGAAPRASADITAFLGITPTPQNRAVRGFAFGFGLLVIGFEFEYANAVEDEVEALPVAADRFRQHPAPDAGRDFGDAVLRHGRRRRLSRAPRVRSRKRTSAPTSAAARRFGWPDRCACGSTTACSGCRASRCTRPISAFTPARICRSERRVSVTACWSASARLTARRCRLLRRLGPIGRGVPRLFRHPPAHPATCSRAWAAAPPTCARTPSARACWAARRSHRDTSPAAPAARRQKLVEQERRPVVDLRHGRLKHVDVEDRAGLGVGDRLRIRIRPFEDAPARGQRCACFSSVAFESASCSARIASS